MEQGVWQKFQQGSIQDGNLSHGQMSGKRRFHHTAGNNLSYSLSCLLVRKDFPFRGRFLQLFLIVV